MTKKIKKIFVVRLVLITLILQLFLIFNFSYVEAGITDPTSLGWVSGQSPKYLADTSSSNKWYRASDISGSNIMTRLRSSYTYNTRRAAAVGLTWMQTRLVGETEGGNNYQYANITTMTVPNQGTTKGFTRWYDSPYGVYFDYQ
ncbi:MAG: hypothetical protein QXG00_08175, partial [Candidatus Woesearchaeota archaeon]